jgi:acetyltransferase-like isoleucine patch superfamily enzyme
MIDELIASDLAPGLLVAPGTAIPVGTRIAPYVTLHAGVELGRRVSIEQGAIVGRPQQIDQRSRSPLLAPGAPTVIGDDCRIGHGTLVVAGARIEAGAYLGDLVSVREGGVVGAQAMIGRGCALSHDVVVGVRARIQNDCILGPWTQIGDDVLVGPRVTFISDPTMGRGGRVQPCVVRRTARIGTAAIIWPVEIGEEAVVAAASLVRVDVAPRTVVAGAPAEWLRDVREDELLDRWRR